MEVGRKEAETDILVVNAARLHWYASQFFFPEKSLIFFFNLRGHVTQCGSATGSGQDSGLKNRTKAYYFGRGLAKFSGRIKI